MQRPFLRRCSMRLALLLSFALAACPEPEPAPADFDEPAPCADGTVEVDGWCVPEDPTPCGEGTVRLGDECVSAERQWVGLPLTEGDTATLGQTFHGNFSHQDRDRYAVDIPLFEGTALAAMRSGTVVAMREDSDTGCGTSDCADDANFVTIDHGDGTQGIYFHLEQNGAVVGVGDGVCAGEVVGYSGNTGWSTGPHLHAAVQNPFGLSLPLRFWELEGVNGGVPAPGMDVVSQNAVDTDCAPPPPADCAEDLFAFLGVRLDPGVPCSLVELDRVYPVSGRTSHGSFVVIGTWRLDPINGGSAWSYQCEPIDADGRFEAELTWPSESASDGSYLAFTAAQDNCVGYGGWAYSVRISFR